MLSLDFVLSCLVLSCLVLSCLFCLGQGAFIVNGSIDATGLVSGVRLLAEAGGRCVFLNPWELPPASDESQAAVAAVAAAAVPKVICGGVAVAVTSAQGPGSESAKAVGEEETEDEEEEEEEEEEGQQGGWFQFETKPGDVCTIGPK
eukprot:COSAG06_NODE_4244_length_4437_cov_3.925772_1_plen_147_part_00